MGLAHLIVTPILEEQVHETKSNFEMQKNNSKFKIIARLLTLMSLTFQFGTLSRSGNVSHLGNNLLHFCCSLLPDWETVSQMGNKI